MWLLNEILINAVTCTEQWRVGNKCEKKHVSNDKDPQSAAFFFLRLLFRAVLGSQQNFFFFFF